MSRSRRAHRLLAWIGTAAVAGGLAVAVPGIAHADPVTYNVTDPGDSGAGTLRQAILDANTHAGSDIITFSLPPATTTISLDGSLPVISDPVDIQGYSQDTGAITPPVRLLETGGPDYVFDFVTGSSGSSVSGLAISADSGTVINAAVRFDEDNIIFDGNWIGLNDTGTAGDDGLFLDGIDVWNDNDSDLSNAEIIGNHIGDPQMAIFVDQGGESDVIAGNTIGGTADQNTSLSGVNQGISLNQTQNETVNFNNIMGVGGGYAIEVNGGNLDLLNGNHIGVLADGTTPIAAPGPGSGIWMHAGASNMNVTNNVIVASASDGIRIDGGDGFVSSLIDLNTIHLVPAGIRILGSNAATIYDNSIYDTSIGIKHGTGFNPSPQGSGGGPAINNIAGDTSSLHVTFDNPAWANEGVSVNVFTNGSCNPNPTPKVGDGKTPIGDDSAVMDDSGHLDTVVHLTSAYNFTEGEFVTATITPPNGTDSTTEFSNCYVVTASGSGNQEPFTTGADPNPTSVGQGDSVVVTLSGYDPDGDPLTFDLPGGGTTNNGNSVTLIGDVQCDANTCTQQARYTADSSFTGQDTFNWTVQDAFHGASPPGSTEVDVVNADLRMANFQWVQSQFTIGQPVDLQLTGLNDGPDVAQNTVLTVSAVGGGQLPAGVSLVSGQGFNNASPSGSCTEASGYITCPIGDLDPSHPLATADVRITTSGLTPNPLQLQAVISSDTPDGNTSNDSYVSLPLDGFGVGLDADLSLSPLVDTPDPVTAGGNVQYTTTVTNNGDVASSVAVQLYGDTAAAGLPTGMTFTSGTLFGESFGLVDCTLDGSNTVVCPLPDPLQQGASADVTVYLQTAPSLANQSVSITAEATLAGLDSNTDNNTASATTEVQAPQSSGDTTVFVPPSNQTETVSAAEVKVVNGSLTPVATATDPTAAAVIVPPFGPGGLVSVAEETCAPPFVCTGGGRGGNIVQRGSLIGAVIRIAPPTDSFYDWQNPLGYTFTYDKTIMTGYSLKQIRVYYVKDSDPNTVLRAKACGTITAATVFPCLKSKRFLKSGNDTSVNGDLRIRLFGTYNDPAAGTRGVRTG